ncbi:MAG: hypothetical protein ACJ8AI_02545 [Rhodopila sp.]
MFTHRVAVVAGCLLVVATDEVQASNDKQQVAPMLAKLGKLPNELGAIETLLAGTVYFSVASVQACMAAEIDPPIAMGRQPPRRCTPCLRSCCCCCARRLQARTTLLTSFCGTMSTWLSRAASASVRAVTVTGQKAVAEKSNGIVAIPALLQRLDLQATRATIDAISPDRPPSAW